jgi:hypothetical protein
VQNECAGIGACESGCSGHGRFGHLPGPQGKASLIWGFLRLFIQPDPDLEAWVMNKAWLVYFIFCTAIFLVGLYLTKKGNPK